MAIMPIESNVEVLFKRFILGPLSWKKSLKQTTRQQIKLDDKGLLAATLYINITIFPTICSMFF
jgi:hypothetical protein